MQRYNYYQMLADGSYCHARSKKEALQHFSAFEGRKVKWTEVRRVTVEQLWKRLGIKT